MKLKRIEHALERARHFRALERGEIPGAWRANPAIARARAEHYENLAQGLLLEGLREYARLDQSPGARARRAYTRARSAGGPGRGAHFRGPDGRRGVRGKKKVPDELAARRAAKDSNDLP